MWDVWPATHLLSIDSREAKFRCREGPKKKSSLWVSDSLPPVLSCAWTCLHCVYVVVTACCFQWVTASPDLPGQGDHFKSRACWNTAELSDFNEKSGPAGLLFLGHILSAIPQEIIQPSPIAKKQMAYRGKKKLRSVRAGKKQTRGHKGKPPAQDLEVLFPPEEMDLQCFVFPPFWPLNFPSHELAYAMERRLDGSGAVSRNTACFNNAQRCWPNILMEDQVLECVLMSCFSPL